MDALGAYDFSRAEAAYKDAVGDLKDRHAEVGVLAPGGKRTFERLGKDEKYGAHRVGSVTKTFSAFLAMKMINEGLIGLSTKCKDVFDENILKSVFENAEYAGEMTLEQLLSHTSGLDVDDHCRKLESCPSTLAERFEKEATIKGGRKFTHITKPGEGIGFYSNAGLAVAGWMMETVYNEKKEVSLSFAEIMKKEIFKGVFHLSDKTEIAPGPTGDIIQSPAGDMKSKTKDLIKVAVLIQKDDDSLKKAFGEGWQGRMLHPRDLFKHHGLGCEANAPAIIHKGLNSEKFGSEERDVSAVVIFPLHSEEAGLVAMCDTNALGPSPKAQKFLKELEAAVGISEAGGSEPPPLTFFCPEKAHLFHGNVYLASNEDPFADEAPPVINCSVNGMGHRLEFDKLEGGVRAYRDENKRPWLCFTKERVIYSDLCLVTKELGVVDLASKQPKNIQSLIGVYREKGEEVYYTFTEKDGRLFMRDGDDEDNFSCLFIDGAWVVGNPTGRPLRLRFDPDGSLELTDIFSGEKQRPYHLKKVIL